jgi:thymidine kinase
VICFGLRSDFQGNPFPGAAQLLTLADDMEEIKTICACGRKATMNIRLGAQGQRVHAGEQVEIGGNNRYLQVCARCFYLGAN